jgi:hypothetical protein
MIPCKVCGRTGTRGLFTPCCPAPAKR